MCFPLGSPPQESAPPAWLTFSCKDESSISDGSTFVDAISSLLQIERAQKKTAITAIGLNCTAPQHVGPLLQSARSVLSTANKVGTRRPLRL